MDAAIGVLGDRLAAAYALGSLAHGGFAPLVSDIDVALIAPVGAAYSPDQIEQIKHDTRANCPNGLADRLSVFWADWNGVRQEPKPYERLPPIDRLDLLQSGRLLHGTDARSPAVRPTASELVTEGARFAVSKFDDDYLATLRNPAELVERGARAATKAALFPPRFLYTLETGRIGHNGDAVSWYSTTGTASGLAIAALGWRNGGIRDEAEAVRLLELLLIPLYLEFFDAYSHAVAAHGNREISDALRARRKRLLSPTR
ncbi:hypothetical protein [Prauserella halophila]|uniref:hypothetical protein n=1 Tax=Prauserella halophila TaxID=185641 RepID=UPI0020A5951F|nr:hypothetical protein [Prauserella halophila]